MGQRGASDSTLPHQTHPPINHTHECTHAYTLIIKHTCMYTHTYTYNIYLHYCTQTLLKQQHITHRHIYIHLHTAHQQAHTCTHARIPFSSSHFISLPKEFIFRLPRTPIIMSQTSIKAFSSHDRFRHLCRIRFCCVASGFLSIFFRSPSEMILASSRSYTSAFASTRAMKRSRKLSRTSSAAQKEKSDQPLKLTAGPPATHIESKFLTDVEDNYTHQSLPGTMGHLHLWAQRDLGAAGEAVALAGSMVVSHQSPKFCAQHPSQAAGGTRRSA